MKQKVLIFLSALMVLSMILAACAPAQPQEVVTTVVVTEVVEVEGETVVEEKVITATPAEEEEMEEEMPAAAGPIPADEMIPCQPIPEVAGINMEQVSFSVPEIAADVPQPVAAPQAQLNQGGNVYRVGVFEDVTTTNFWAANGPDNTVWNSYMLPKPPSLFTLTDKYFTFVPSLAAVTTPEPLVEEGEFWVTEIPIKEGLVWSDGEAITAEDVAFTANAVLGLGLISGNFQQWYDANYLDSMEAVDDLTVKVIYHTKPGLARHEWGSLQAPVVAEHYWAPVVEEAMAPVMALGDSPSDEDLAAAQAEAHDILFSHQVEGEPTAWAFTLDRWEQGAFLEGSAFADYMNTGLTVEQWSNGAYRDSAGVEVGTPEGDVETTIEVGPNVDSVVYSVYGSQDAAILAMKNGEIDYVINPLGLQRGLADQIKTDPNLTVLENNVNGFRYMSFNNRRRPMNDCAFRQAVAVLIDKEFVTGTILQGVAFPLYTFVPEANTAWYFDDVPKLGQGLTREQRTNLAVAILEQAGYTWEGDVKPTWDPDGRAVNPGGHLIMPDGTPVPELNIPAPSPGYDPLRSTFAIWIETWLKEFGVPATAQLAGFNVIVPIIFTEQDFDMYLLGWSLGLFPDYLRDFFAEEQAVQDGNNAGGYVNAKFEELSEGILSCESFETCKEISDEIQLMLATEVPYVLLFDTGIIEGYRSASLELPYEETLSGLQYAHQYGGELQASVKVR
jgi:ABC-type transport system substrate-binding protein